MAVMVVVLEQLTDDRKGGLVPTVLGHIGPRDGSTSATFAGNGRDGSHFGHLREMGAGLSWSL